MSILPYFLLSLIPFSISTSFNFTNITQQNSQNILLSGDASYNSTQGLLVTHEKNNNRTWLTGRATYIEPLHLYDKNSADQASFSTTFTLAISSYPNNSYGDGLTFFIAQNNSVLNGGGSLGLPFSFTAVTGRYPFVAVEFDTFCNSEWDPTDSNGQCIGEHVGIDVNSISSVKSRKWYNNITEGKECRVLIEYDSGSKTISVSFTNFRNGASVWETGLNHTVDLTKVLPEWVIFGFTAATGVYIEKNIIRSWSFNSSELKAVPRNTSPSPGPNAVNGRNKKLLIVELVAGMVVLVALLLIFGYFLWWRKKKNGNEVQGLRSDAEMSNEFEMGPNMPRRFTYRELARATSKFAESEKLGEGGFGDVYKGFLKDIGTYVAVKRVSKTSRQGMKEYAAEVRIISQLRHRNLVQLTGWCHEKGELLVVYEFLENGSLDFHLFKGKSALTWNRRYKIAQGLASAVLYLHEEWEQCILHRDIKSSNVMLDTNFNAKLGDFGLAKLVDHEKGSQTTILAGTLGYMAPECAATGRATKESDVYSFGIVVLEIACGRKPIVFKGPENQMRLVDWVWELFGTDTLLKAVDPNLGSEFEDEEIKRLMIVGLWCVHPDSNLRPSMRQAIKVLNFEASLPLLPSKMPVASYSSNTSSSLSGYTSIGQLQSSRSFS